VTGDEPTISWPQLVVLMAYGDGHEDRYRGTYRVRESDPPEEYSCRAYRRGRLLRVEAASGEPRFIFGRDKRWIFDGTGVPLEYDRATSSFGIGDTALLERWATSRWEGEDFTVRTGAITASECLGRRVWTFELAPPPHKPYPLQVIVDAATGLVLRQANADLGSFQEWTDLELEADLPDQLFSWEGPTRTPEDREAEHERDMRRRRAWLAGRGVTDLTLPVDVELVPHEWDESTGEFHASVHARGPAGSLLRRPRSAQRWDEVESMAWPHSHRWHDERWDWFLGTDQRLTPEQLRAVRTQLARTH
jgi:hypothetical protein